MFFLFINNEYFSLVYLMLIDLRMIPIRKMIALAFAVCICGISVSGFAQMREFQKKIPEGKWTLEKESVRAFIPGCMHSASDAVGANHIHQPDINVNINDIDIVIYTELDVKQDSIMLISAKNTLRTKYTYSNRQGIRYEASSVPFLPGGNVYGAKLYVQQRIDKHSLRSASPVFVSYIYELKAEK